MPAAEIVNKNIAARGGLQAWRAVQSISMEGKLGAGGNQRAHLPEPMPGKKRTQAIPTDQRPKDELQLPFTLELQRGRKQRFELLFNGKQALQVYDGSNGWKLRPYLNRMEVEPFTTDELKASSMQPDLDGYLVDYASKGIQVAVDGMEKVEDRDTYKLKLTLKNGQALHVWIDARTYLETKIEGAPRRLDGVEHPVEVYYRDYRTVNGLQIPFVLETRVVPIAAQGHSLSNSFPPEKIAIDKVVVNPKLDASLFTKPAI
jgi:outer membrane lipoprotein-sorting protein